jgi:hypothetical protein
MGFTPYCFADDSATRNFVPRRFSKAGAVPTKNRRENSPAYDRDDAEAYCG